MRLDNLSENEHLEIKERCNINVVTTICAFLNTNGGVLIIGYSERLQKIVGLKHSDEELFSKAISLIRPDPEQYIKVTREEYQGENYLQVTIHRSSDLHYVVGYRGNLPIYYFRHNSSDIKMDYERALYHHGIVGSNLPFVKEHEPSDNKERFLFRKKLIDSSMLNSKYFEH